MDAPPTNEPLPGKATFTFWLLAALLLLIVALVGFSLFGPNPPIEIGKATTHITTPLDANGLPDYAAALLAESRKSVTPENNGAVPFLMAMWPEEGSEDGYTAEDAKLLCAELGLPGVPPVEDRITSLYSDKYRLAALRLLRERLPKPKELSTTADPVDLDFYQENGMEDWIQGSEEDFFNAPESKAIRDGRVTEFLSYCEPTGGPWTAEELPFLAEWIEENNRSIDLLIEAAERTEWHLPSPTLLRGGSGAMFGAFGSIQQLRSAARLLQTRSSFYHARGDYDEAARDALAVLRLSHHTSKGPSIVDQLVSMAIGGMGLGILKPIAADESAPVETLRSMLLGIEQIGSFSRMTYTFDHGERFWALDTAVDSYANKNLVLFKIEEFFSASYISYDWNPSLRALNGFYDTVAVAGKLPTRTQRQTAFSQIMAKSAGIVFPPTSAREMLGLFTIGGRSQVLAEQMVKVIGGAIYSYYQAEDRVTTNRQLTRLGIALAIYRAEQGTYPATLDEIVPSVLQKLPVDLFHNHPFAYRKTADGYLLYSLGANGTDEGGSNSDMTWGMSKLEGVEIQEPDDFYENESDWDENGEYIGGSMMEPEGDLDNPFAKIPAGADDLSLRIPLPEPEPWPWETTP